jgi:hypothetical protein
LSHSPTTFCFLVIFSGRVSHFCLVGLDCCTPTYIYLVTGIIGMYHHTQFICWDRGVSLTFSPGWPWTMIFPTSISQIAGITGVNHHTQLVILIKRLPLPIFMYCFQWDKPFSMGEHKSAVWKGPVVVYGEDSHIISMKLCQLKSILEYCLDPQQPRV